MKREDQNIEQETASLSLLKNEDGSIMIEFLIVAPFLFLCFTLITLNTSLSRFRASAEQLAAVRVWQSVGKVETGQKPSDEIPVRLDVGSFSDDLGVLDDYLQYATLRRAFAAGPVASSLFSGGASLSGLAAIAIYAGPEPFEDFGSLPGSIDQYYNHPIDTLDLPLDNYSEFAVSLGTMSDLDAEGDLASFSSELAYRNSHIFKPVEGFANFFVSDPTGRFDIDKVRITGNHGIMYEPHSLSYEPSPSTISVEGARLRRVDRLTTTRFPYYTGAYIAQTMISGNFAPNIPQVMEDNGFTDGVNGDSWVGGALSGLSDLMNAIGGVTSLLEQAQPLRKVDKDFGPDHDLDLEMDDRALPFSIRKWGSGEIDEKNKLENDKIQTQEDLWSMIQ